MLIKLLGLIAIVSVAAAIYFVLRPVLLPEEPEQEPCSGDACGPAGVSAEQTLADRYAPVVYLADRVTACDEAFGDFRPIPVDVVLGNPQVVLRNSRDAAPKAGPTASDLYGLGTQAYIDLPGAPRRPGCRYVRDGQAFAAGQPNVAYARIATEDGHEELVLQYWLYFYFNQWNNKHESDWEMIQLAFDATSAEDALDQSPARVAFSQHSSGELAQWTDDKLSKEGDRPVLYVAAGSHSNRYTQKVFLGRGEQGFGCDEADGQARVPLEARLMPSTISGPDDPYAWLTFEGRWGELAGPEFDGPTGPNMKTQWDHPLTWESDLRTSSVRLPDRNAIGPSGLDAFCNVVAWGSNVLLPVYLQMPALSLAILGLVGVAMVVSLSRTRYRPSRREPLRERRRLGQVLTSAASIYTTHLRLFLGIGLVFLPVALAVSVVHWLLLHISPVDPVVPVPRADIAQDVIVAFALSELQFGLAYGIVLVACTAALRAIEQDRPSSARDAYLDAWHAVPRFLAPRAFAAVVTMGLAFTVVGIPLAIRQAVRWTFVEQATLLDGEANRGALGLSSRIADRDLWWAAGSTIVLALTGLFLAPAIGILLIVTAPSIPLGNVNLITSVIHVGLVPFVAIAFALVYFDLRSRTDSTDAADETAQA